MKTKRYEIQQAAVLALQEPSSMFLTVVGGAPLQTWFEAPHAESPTGRFLYYDPTVDASGEQTPNVLELQPYQNLWLVQLEARDERKAPKTKKVREPKAAKIPREPGQPRTRASKIAVTTDSDVFNTLESIF
jgi:hypothetical protein